MIGLIEYATRPACIEALALVRRSFRMIEDKIPRAQWVPWDGLHNWRFVEQTHEQLLLQKLARQITGVQTIDLLLMAGHLQEIGVLYRMLDEIEQDISFIAIGIRNGAWTAHHDRYVKYFWSEDDEDRQPPVQRKTIRAYLNRAFDHPDPALGDSVGRTLHKAYSDYAHARSAPIMGMVKGPPASFDIDGITNAEARYPYVDQHPAYFYRCLVSTCMIANIVLSDRESELIYNSTKVYEQQYHSLLFA